MLRDYFQKHRQGADFALELPTGAGKTAVGLLIAEWHRRTARRRTAFLTLTNQLAGQVIDEAKALSLPVADLRGNKESRERQQEMRFREGDALAVSTYSNLFNVNPVIAQCSTLIFDDAHGGASFAASMWSVRVSAEELPEHYERMHGTLAPLLTAAQSAEIEDAFAVAFVDLRGQHGVIDQLRALLDALPEKHSAAYAWGRVRAHLEACHVLLTNSAVTIRPYVPPTWSHTHFSSADRRCFLSATMGDSDDLKRAYGIQSLQVLRARSAEEGKRYVFAPGMAMDDQQIKVAISQVWKSADPRRAVGVAPSFLATNGLVAKLSPMLSGARFIQAKDIEESLVPFTSQSNIVLAVANRYDGLDLPDDDCRLLILSESPRAVNDLEAGLSSVWQLGKALRGKEATRLVQGMGRCTRSATDYAVILLLGESLINAVTTPDLVARFPASLRAQIAWGKAQLNEVTQNPVQFAELVSGLISDATYRAEANEAIDELQVQEKSRTDPDDGPSIGSKEVLFCRSLWNGDFSHAMDTGRGIADQLSGDEWTGLRGWWLYMTSVAAFHAGETTAELDAIRRAKATGINSGWLDHLLRARAKVSKSTTGTESPDDSNTVRQSLWSSLEKLGWVGRKYLDFCKEMTSNIAATNNHKLFHLGLVSMGTLLGAKAWAPVGQGVPDVIWGFGDSLWVCLEAKCEKLSAGTGFAKRDLLEAKGHVDWLKANVPLPDGAVIHSIVIGPSAKTHEVAEPHKSSLFFLSNDVLLKKARELEQAAQKLRVKFTGRDFAAAKDDFGVEMERVGLDLAKTTAFLTRNPL